MAQWRGRSPPINMSRVRFPDPSSYVGWVCCCFSTLLQEVFLRVLRFSPLLKNQHFLSPIRSWNARAFLNEFLWTPWCSVGKQINFHSFFFFFFTFSQWQGCSTGNQWIESLLGYAVNLGAVIQNNSLVKLVAPKHITGSPVISPFLRFTR